MLLACAPAQAKSCGPLRQVAVLSMTPVAGSARVSTFLSIDGKAVSLLLDTGAGSSGLTRVAAARLNLRSRESGTAHLQDADGHVVRRYFVTDVLGVGPLTARRIPFLLETNVPTSLDGTLGPDLMLRYDVEMDFAKGRVAFFSQDHCAGHVVHWAQRPVAQVPIMLDARAHDYPPPMPNPAAGGFETTPQENPILGTDIRTSVMLDGHQFTASIDTGSDLSTINSDVARRYYDADAKPFSTANDPLASGTASESAGERVTVTAWRATRRFHTLTFGGVSAVDPLFAIRPALPGAGRTGAQHEPDVTIGMNILSRLHLYFAFGERMLYVSPAASAQGREQHG